MKSNTNLVYRRSSCRLCDEKNLELVLQLTPTPPVDAFIKAERLSIKQNCFPLDLYLCHACGHVQLLDVVSPDILFGDYIYETSSSPGLIEHFRRYADDLLQYANISEKSLIIDIGSNDGTLLRPFKEKGFKTLGVDPAQSIADKATKSGITTIPDFFSNKLAQKIEKDYGSASIITANNVFAHVDNLGDIVDGVHTLLSKDGLFVCEVSYLLDTVDNMVFDFIYHEHLDYHSVIPLKKFLMAHGLELIHVHRVPTKGGSLRCFSQPIGGSRKRSASVDEFVRLEENRGIHKIGFLKSFNNKINNAKDELLSFLNRLEDKKFFGYGASATTTILTYHFQLGNKLSHILDDNPFRQNRFSPGYHIPVVSPKIIYEERPEYVLILAWRFSDMIISQHKTYMDNNGHFIVPLPNLKII